MAIEMAVKTSGVHPRDQDVAGSGMGDRHADHQACRGDDAVVRSQDGSAPPANPIGPVSLSMWHEHGVDLTLKSYGLTEQSPFVSGRFGG